MAEVVERWVQVDTSQAVDLATYRRIFPDSNSLF